MAGRTLRCLTFLGMMLVGLAGEGRAAVPAGFSDIQVTSSLAAPTALAFTPDGRMLIAQKSGGLRIWHGTLLATPALTIPAGSICTESERGLLGIAVDPDFATNRRIYLFYTARTGGICVNRVSRFTFFAAAAQQNQIDPASELILVDNMPSPNGNHNAGDLHFGKDGFLYISIGEGGIASAARNEHVLTGKILRITRDGGIPPTNPFQGAGTARCNVTGSTSPGQRCQETFAWGFRNPFRFAMDPNAAGTRFFINDVGQSSWEEIDEAQAGADYGWNCREGAHTNSTSGACSPTPPGMVDPIFEYPHSATVPGTSASNCHSITGGAFVPDGLWPGFDGTYLFSDFICGAIFKLTQSGTWSASDFATSLGGSSAVHLAFGPWGTTRALYYTDLAAGEVRRISRRVPRPGGPLDFHTLQPCRVADTRLDFGMQGGPALASNVTRTFQAAGLCGVPATASSVALIVTVVTPSTAGFLRIDPGDEPASDTSAVNFAAGETRANNAVSFLGTAGDLAVTLFMPSGTGHVLIDVTGYFE